MKNYNIGGVEFHTKLEIKDYTLICIDKLGKLTQEQSDFIFDLITFHPRPKFGLDIKHLTRVKRGRSYSLQVVYNDGRKAICSHQGCIMNIPVVEAEYTLKFGKYIGLTLPEVADIDIQYLKWMISDKFEFYPEAKARAIQFLADTPIKLQEKLQVAIQEENYELAIELREKLKRI